MDRATIEPAIKIVMTEIHSKLNEAARIAKAAEACALAGSIAEGVTVLMDIEQLGPRLIKSTTQGLRPDRQRPGSFEPAGHSVLRCA